MLDPYDSPENLVKLTIAPARVVEQMDQLDAATDSGKGANARQHERFSYRIGELRLELRDFEGQWKKYACPTRDISSRGMAVMIGHFVYNNTLCRVTITGDNGAPIIHEGKVVRCRYIAGTGRLHEIGIRFNESLRIGPIQDAPATSTAGTSAVTPDGALVSTLASDESKIESIDKFVNELPGRMTELQGALEAADGEKLAALSKALCEDADACGFAPISAAVREFLEMFTAKAAADDLKLKMTQITKIAGRAAGESCREVPESTTTEAAATTTA